MNRTALITTEKKHENPILVVDKKGVIGQELANKLKDEALVIFVSKKSIGQSENIVHIPFIKKFPTIPDNTYSHIFLIDEDFEIGKDVLQAFIKKAKNDNSLLIVCLSIYLAKESFINGIISSYDKAKIVLLGDIFQKDQIYNSSTQINKFIIKAKTEGKIEISGDGTAETYPVFFDDVISGILEIVFGDEEKNKIFNIFPKHKITLLMLSRMFLKADPNLKIGFITEAKVNTSNFVPLTQGKYILGENYALEERIKKIDFSNLTIDPVKDKKNNFNYEEKKNGFSFSIIFVFLIFLIFLPLFSTLIFSFLGVNSLYLIKNSLEKKEVSYSKQIPVFALQSFNIANQSVNILYEEAKIIGQQARVEELRKKINLGIDLSNALISATDAFDKLKTVFLGTSKNPNADFNSSLIDFKSALYTYNKEKETGFIPKSVADKLSDAIKISFATIDFWPDIFGFNGQKTYLVLFQNNMELRPGGGFIGSYAVLTLNKGKVLSFKIYDVYDADGQLKAHVEPPFAIRRYLPSAHWYLRDSNFNVDFSKGAIASVIFLNSEMHQSVDGVIGVDLSFIKSLLTVIGKVEVNDYKQTVDSDNFFQVIQSHVQNDFFPGSTQKKDFLKSFYTSLQLKIANNKNISYFNLLKIFSNSIYEKHILFAFNNQNQQTSFAVNGLSSALIDERATDDTNINDFIGISEANLGVDKVNYYMTRSLSQSVSIKDDGSILENLTLAIKNTAKASAWTGGHYKNYLRIILPLETSIKKISIDGKEQKIIPAVTDPVVYEKKNFTPLPGLEVEKANQGGKTVYGFLVNLSPQDLRTIQIEYELRQKLNQAKSDFTYSLKIFKQPGIDFFPYDLSLNFPANLMVVKSSEEIKNNTQKSILSTQITRDREVRINLAPK